MHPRHVAWLSVILGPLVAILGIRAVLAQQSFPPLEAAVLPVKTEEADRVGLSFSKKGHPENGALIVSRGTPNGVAACAQCHAFNGASDGSGAFPRLSGQDEHYLLKELHDFTTDQRRNAIMTPFALRLTDQEKADVAAYYAAQTAVPLPPAIPPHDDADGAMRLRGREIATVGSAPLAVQNCTNCHGAQGTGERPDVPYLQGQYSGYIVRQFAAWKQGYRKNGSGNQMHEIATKLPDADVRAVARYFEQLRLDGPAADPNQPASLNQLNVDVTDTPKDIPNGMTTKHP